jgi:hypothetical protein
MSHAEYIEYSCSLQVFTIAVAVPPGTSPDTRHKNQPLVRHRLKRDRHIDVPAEIARAKPPKKRKESKKANSRPPSSSMI